MNLDPSHRWPQFSLRSALIAMVVFGVAASFWVSLRANRESLRLREENVRLRNEVGELTIEPGNENKVHAIAVPELEARTWKWRVYIPEGRTLGLQVQTKSNNSSGSSWSAFSPGEYTVVVALRRDLNNHLEWIIRESQGGSSGETRQTASANVEKLINNYSAGLTGVSHSTSFVEPGQDLDLLKFEMAGTNASESITVTIHDGPH